MSTIDTPDFQRGVVSAQALLASVAGGVGTVRVGVPPNAETVIVTMPNATGNNLATVTGVTSGDVYAGAKCVAPAFMAINNTWFFDVSAAVDTQVDVTITPAPPLAWFVYSDAAAHIIADVTKLTDSHGVQFMAAVAPGSSHQDHPPHELLAAASGAIASGTAILPAPGVGSRYRIFYATIAAETAGNGAALRDSISGAAFAAALSGIAGLPTPVDYKPSGVALSDNAAVNLTTDGGNGRYNIVITVENV